MPTYGGFLIAGLINRLPVAGGAVEIEEYLGFKTAMVSSSEKNLQLLV
jgi:hypothetical protein